MIVKVTLTAWVPDGTSLDPGDYLVKIGSRRDSHQDMRILAIHLIEEMEGP
jgi:hypothetical protein